MGKINLPMAILKLRLVRRHVRGGMGTSDVKLSARGEVYWQK